MKRHKKYILLGKIDKRKIMVHKDDTEFPAFRLGKAKFKLLEDAPACVQELKDRLIEDGGENLSDETIETLFKTLTETNPFMPFFTKYGLTRLSYVIAQAKETGKTHLNIP